MIWIFHFSIVVTNELKKKKIVPKRAVLGFSQEKSEFKSPNTFFLYNSIAVITQYEIYLFLREENERFHFWTYPFRKIVGLSHLSCQPQPLPTPLSSVLFSSH